MFARSTCRRAFRIHPNRTSGTWVILPIPSAVRTDVAPGPTQKGPVGLSDPSAGSSDFRVEIR